MSKRPSAKTRAKASNSSKRGQYSRQSSLTPRREKDRRIQDFYDMGDVLGSGSFGTVVQGTSLSSSDDEPVAIKIIEKSRNGRGANSITLLKQEISIMKKLDHDNIVHLIDSFEDDTNVYMVMHIMEGGELYDCLMARGSFCEADVRLIINQICSAVEYLHEQGIIHRDLKPENLLLRRKDDLKSLQLTDFGLSALSTDNDQFFDDFAGTPLYLAPEIINENDYDRKVDTWSIGVIMFQLLCGTPPFKGDSRDELFENITTGNYNYDDFAWIDVTESAKDLIDHLLVLKPSSRYSVSEILNHPWMSGEDGDDPLPTVVEMMKAFEAWRRLRRVANTTLAIVRMQKAISAVQAFSSNLAGNEEEDEEGEGEDDQDQ